MRRGTMNPTIRRALAGALTLAAAVALSGETRAAGRGPAPYVEGEGIVKFKRGGAPTPMGAPPPRAPPQATIARRPRDPPTGFGGYPRARPPLPQGRSGEGR